MSITLVCYILPVGEWEPRFFIYVYMKIIFLILALATFFFNPFLSLFLVFLLAWVQTNQIQGSPLQQKFLAGAIPAVMPDGFYKGSVDFYHDGWRGKKFVASEQRGVNVFTKFGQDTDAYPFKTYVGPALRDHGLEVLKIDYQAPGVPFYVRPILDEIVEVEPGKFLGKIHYRLIPWFPFAIGYFWLEK